PATPGPTPQGPTPRTTDPIIPPPDRIASAATLPALHLLNARTEAWASERTPAGRFAGLIPDDAAHFRVVLLFNLPSHTADRAGRETLTRTAAAINTAIARARNVSPDPSVTLSAASVAVLELEGFDDARRRAQDAWQQLDPTAAAPALPLLCSPAGRAMYARFSARLVPVIVVVDERLAIREMIEIEPGAGVPADLVERLASMLSTGP
ncbi:MAG TPA: hypothetical protein VK176_11415, partial [Phycisphaerales bacterium]|nr:hypothetical protein [Phycisphaerales bacterium]